MQQDTPQDTEHSPAPELQHLLLWVDRLIEGVVGAFGFKLFVDGEDRRRGFEILMFVLAGMSNLESLQLDLPLGLIGGDLHGRPDINLEIR